MWWIGEDGSAFGHGPKPSDDCDVASIDCTHCREKIAVAPCSIATHLPSRYGR